MYIIAPYSRTAAYKLKFWDNTACMLTGMY